MSLTMALDAGRQLEQLPLVHLVEHGFFAARGINLRLVALQAGQEALPRLLAGRADLAVLDVPTIARAAERHADVIGVFQLYSRDLSTVFALARSGLSDVDQLARQRMGVTEPPGSALHALTATLRTGSIGLNDLSLVRTTSSLPILLEAGRVVAVAAPGHLRAWFESLSLPIVTYPTGGWDVVPGSSVVTTGAMLHQARPVLADVVGALRAGISALVEAPDRLRQAAEQRLPVDDSRRHALRAQMRSLGGSLADFSPMAGPGWAEAAIYQEAERFLREVGITDGSVDVTQIVTNDLISRDG